MNEGYAFCMNSWALDKEIKDELGLLIIISSLCAEKGYCYSGNKFLAQIFKTDETTISKKIKKLINKNYLYAEYTKTGAVINERKLRLVNMPTAVAKNAKEINIKESNNIINNNIITKESKFVKPNIEEIREYCFERKNGINAENFYDFYESKNWMIGKNKMKDWRACIRTWERNKGNANNIKNTANIVPEWFDKEIDSTEDFEEDIEFKKFIEEIRK